MEWVMEHWSLIVTVLFALSELLAAIPAVKANSVYQLLVQILQALKPAPKAD